MLLAFLPMEQRLHLLMGLLYHGIEISSSYLKFIVLGLCDFVKYEGSRPMNITWKLKRAIPAKYLRKTNKLVV